MQTIQVVIEEALLEATDRAVRRLKLKRSAFVRDALREHLKRVARLERERRDREGYRVQAPDDQELRGWDKVAAWPDK